MKNLRLGQTAVLGSITVKGKENRCQSRSVSALARSRPNSTMLERKGSLAEEKGQRDRNLFKRDSQKVLKKNWLKGKRDSWTTIPREQDGSTFLQIKKRKYLMVTSRVLSQPKNYKFYFKFVKFEGYRSNLISFCVIVRM